MTLRSVKSTPHSQAKIATPPIYPRPITITYLTVNIKVNNPDWRGRGRWLFSPDSAALTIVNLNQMWEA